MITSQLVSFFSLFSFSFFSYLSFFYSLSSFFFVVFVFPFSVCWFPPLKIKKIHSRTCNYVFLKPQTTHTSPITLRLNHIYLPSLFCLFKFRKPIPYNLRTLSQIFLSSSELKSLSTYVFWLVTALVSLVLWSQFWNLKTQVIPFLWQHLPGIFVYWFHSSPNPYPSCCIDPEFPISGWYPTIHPLFWSSITIRVVQVKS